MDKPIKEVFGKYNEKRPRPVDLTGPAIKAADAVKDKLMKQAAEDAPQPELAEPGALPADEQPQPVSV